MQFKRIAIVGTGAVGGYYGGRLAAAGRRVNFLARSDADALRAHGLRVRSISGDFTVPRPSVYTEAAAMPPADLVIVTLKATATAHYARLVRPLLHEGSNILCLQNGLGNEEVMREAFDKAAVLGAIAYTCINRVGPGRIDHTAHGMVRVGAFAGANATTAEAVATLMRSAGIDAAAVDDLHHFRWQKLVWNVPFNGWGAALDRHTEQLLATPHGERLIRDTMDEVVRAAASVGVTLEPGIIDKQIAQTRQMGAYHSSMQLDRQAGRQMEIDAVIAEPLRRATVAGCGPLPKTETMLACLRALSVE